MFIYWCTFQAWGTPKFPSKSLTANCPPEKVGLQMLTVLQKSLRTKTTSLNVYFSQYSSRHISVIHIGQRKTVSGVHFRHQKLLKIFSESTNSPHFCFLWRSVEQHNLMHESNPFWLNTQYLFDSKGFLRWLWQGLWFAICSWLELSVTLLSCKSEVFEKTQQPVKNQR